MTDVPKNPSPIPVPIPMSGTFAGSPLGTLPFGATFLGPRLQTAKTR